MRGAMFRLILLAVLLGGALAACQFGPESHPYRHTGEAHVGGM